MSQKSPKPFELDPNKLRHFFRKYHDILVETIYRNSVSIKTMLQILKRGSAFGQSQAIRVVAGKSSPNKLFRWSSTSSSPNPNGNQAVANGDLKIGDVIHGYKLEQVDFIKELNIKPFYLRHQSTGAEHLHIEKEGDSNNVFAISVRTTPENSTGVAHILEHLALCGSKNYKVRDPFFKMTTRSLATFMNAMTGPDFTVYPFSTQNSKDFENLLRVYTDAVFFPRLRQVDFRQEAWRLEHEEADKKDTPIVIRGVVYNEMKGVFSSSSAIYARQLLNSLFPDTTYQYESGGDPEVIPSLSHEELVKFHQNHYHPSNAKFFTYGDMPLANHLGLLNELVLSKFSENSLAREKSLVQDQEPWTEPKTVNITCPFDPLSASPEKQTTTSVSFMLPTTITNFEDMFSLQLLSSLLIDGPNAPFYKSLIESGLGSDYSPSTGLGNYTKQPYFSIGLQNIHPNDVARVHQIIEKTFQDAAVSGFPQERIDAILHDIELGLKHVSGNFGLRLAMNLESVWNHEGDAIDYLKVNSYVEKFKHSLKTDKNYLKTLIGKHFMSNKHKLILNMNPDVGFEDNRKQSEAKLLEKKLSSLKDIDRQTILYEGMELQKMQNAKENVSLLPCLEPSKDIPKDLIHKTELKFEVHKGINIQMCEQPTNEVIYFRALADVGSRLEELKLLDYLPIFCDVATKLGAGAYDRHKFAQRMQLTTGGLSTSLVINPSLQEFDLFKSQVLLGSHCLRRNVGHMFDLWQNVFEEIHLKKNLDHLHQLIKASAADLAESVPHSGQMYAIKRASASLSKLASLDERLSGLSFIARMKDMASKEPVESIAAKLEIIAQIVFDPHNLKCSLNAEKEAMPDTLKDTASFLSKLINITDKKSSISETSKKTATSKETDFGYEATKVDDMKFPFATHYVAKSLIAVPRMHEDFSKLCIMSKLISSKFLLREVREKGGAYGAGLRLSNAGMLNFYSYRDPNTDRTMKIFDSSADWVSQSQEYTEKDIEESKLGVFQEVDKPVEPGRRGLNYFSMGETDEIRQEHRRRLLNVSKSDVMDVADKYLRQDKSGSYII